MFPVNEGDFYTIGKGNEGALHLAESMKANCLKELDLSGNSIGDEGAIAIIRAIVNKTSMCIKFSGNEISDNGAIKIAEILKQGPSSKKLDSEDNAVFSHLTNALNQRRTRIEDSPPSSPEEKNSHSEGGKIFEDLMEALTRRRLGLENSSQSSNRRREKNNPSHVIFLDENQIGEEGIKALKEAEETNSKWSIFL